MWQTARAGSLTACLVVEGRASPGLIDCVDVGLHVYKGGGELGSPHRTVANGWHLRAQEVGGFRVAARVYQTQETAEGIAAVTALS